MKFQKKLTNKWKKKCRNAIDKDTKQNKTKICLLKNAGISMLIRLYTYFDNNRNLACKMKKKIDLNVGQATMKS